MNDPSKPMDAFRICRELRIVKDPVSNEVEESLIRLSAEVEELLQCMALIRVSRQELRRLKAEELTHLQKEEGSHSLTQPRQSSLILDLQQILRSESLPLEEKAIKLWKMMTSVNSERCAEEQRNLLCESPESVKPVLSHVQQIWETYIFRELATLSDSETDVYKQKELFCDSQWMRLIRLQPYRWLSWELLTASFEAMLRFYSIGLRILSQLTALNAFKESFQVISLLSFNETPTSSGYLSDKFQSFALPLLQQSLQISEDRCRHYFHSSMNKFLQSLSGSHVLLRLQTSRKIKVDGPSDCLRELECLAKETSECLKEAPPFLSSNIWLGYARGLDSSILKSAQEIRTQFESSKKYLNGSTSPIQQLLLNAEKAEKIFDLYCPQEHTQVFRVLRCLVQKLRGMK